MPNAAPRPVKAGDHLYLVDGSSYIFRAYHALPPLTRKSDGLPVGAAAGFCNMLWKLLRDLDGEAPTHLAVIFDYSAVTFRNRIYDRYKAHRPEPPDDLKPQFKLIREAVHAFNVACIEQEGYEADDLIATYTRQAVDAGATVTIVASDKDLMQLIEPGVEMYDSMKDRRIAGPEVFEKFGVDPVHVADVQALAGDSIDNVPGVPGIGVKTAASLIVEYGDLETLLARAAEIKQPKRRQALIDYADQARVSRQLVELMRDVPLDIPLEQLSVRQPDPERLIAFLKGMEFTTLTKRVADATGLDTGKVEATPVAVDGWAADEPVHGPDMQAPAAAPTAPAPAREVEPGSPGTPAALAASRAEKRTPVDRSVYETVTGLEALDRWIAEAAENGRVAVALRTSVPDPMSADIVGIALATGLGRAAYVPLAHRATDGLDLVGGGAPQQIALPDALSRLKPLLEAPGVLKIGHDFKHDWVVLERHGIETAPLDDTLLVSYVLDSGAGGHGLEELSKRHLDHAPLGLAEIAGSGRNRISFDLVPIERASEFAAERAEVALRLDLVLKPRLPGEHVATVYETLERPLMPVLARMERRGILVDRQMLARLSGDFAQKMVGLEAEIHELAGESFNIGSPKQLGEILFDKMGLQGGRKTKTGAYTTGADVLEELAAGHDLPRKVLDWRQVSKLKSTYTDALPGYVNASTGRVHTSFALASTTTGRLSSSEPNLQNIPVRTEEGRQIRCAFIAQPGTKLVSADYSQIELRVLAHMAEIPQLSRAFSDGMDIHATTASEMFGTPVEGMDPMVRRRAKAINFGIIYGISAFGLANQLSIPREEAAAYIKRYFERFPGIRDYMDRTRAFAREHGYVTTVFGRKCHYPNIRKGHPSERAFYERAAINAPIQGSAADIIRRAMIRMDAALETARIEARMLLQVHDELVFEIPEEAVDDAIPLITGVMEQAALPAVSLKVPLQVDARAASNWEEAH